MKSRVQVPRLGRRRVSIPARDGGSLECVLVSLCPVFCPGVRNAEVRGPRFSVAQYTRASREVSTLVTVCRTPAWVQDIFSSFVSRFQPNASWPVPSAVPCSWLCAELIAESVKGGPCLLLPCVSSCVSVRISVSLEVHAYVFSIFSVRSFNVTIRAVVNSPTDFPPPCHV